MTNPSTPIYREIPLTQGQVAIVSSIRFDFLNQWKWTAQWNKFTQSFYAVRRGKTDANGKRETIRMHRVLLGLSREDPRKGDHIDLNTLNNQDDNLRIATSSQNNMNRLKQKNNTSGIKGVSQHRNRWQALIGVEGRIIYLGSRETKEEAALLYEEGAKKYHLAFART